VYHAHHYQSGLIEMQKTLIYLLAAVVLASCAHKIDIQQGNVVTEEQLAKVKTGMEPQKVRAILGTPLLTDPFHNDRWDYFFSLGKGNTVEERYRVTLFFKNNRLSRIKRVGDVPKTEKPTLEPKL
jgi:outer membrane protein assembly factor BamE